MTMMPGMTDYKMDIIVLTHGRLDLTLSCIQSIFENTKAPFHLIIVDDSTDFTPQYLRWLQKQHDNVVYIHSDEPYKEGNRAINMGLLSCVTPYVTIIANSMKVEPDWESVALDLMAENHKIGVIGFKVLFPSGFIESAGVTIPNYVPLDIGNYESGHRYTSIYECQAVMWSFVMLRREAAGTLEENVYHGFRGWDDYDNCLVIKKKGWDIVYCGYGVGYHTPRATRGAGTPEQEKLIVQENRQNAIIFYKRWGYWDKVQAKNSGDLTGG